MCLRFLCWTQSRRISFAPYHLSSSLGSAFPLPSLPFTRPVFLPLLSLFLSLPPFLASLIPLPSFFPLSSLPRFSPERLQSSPAHGFPLTWSGALLPHPACFALTVLASFKGLQFGPSTAFHGLCCRLREWQGFGRLWGIS